MSESTDAGRQLAGEGPQLSENLPQQAVYSGQNYLELRLDPEDFLATATAQGQGLTEGQS